MSPRAEWLETDGLGGYASGPVAGPRTRRYHALLVHALTPPTGRTVLVNGFDGWLELGGARYPLTSQRYAPDVTTPVRDASGEPWGVAGFEHEPWPRWTLAPAPGIELHHELFMPDGVPAAVLTWRLTRPIAGARLVLRPFLSGRDAHATHHENGAFAFEAAVEGARVRWRPYADLPAVVVLSNGRYAHQPFWYRSFQYDDERERGLDFVEDLASPGTFTFELDAGEAVWIVGAEGSALETALGGRTPDDGLEQLRQAELARRAAFSTPLHRAADQYLVRRGSGRTIVAGYPWFGDWGRDTFIALRGLCLATGRLEVAAQILAAWAERVSRGMLPNYFPEGGRPAEYNSVDASLWYVVAVHELQEGARARGWTLPAAMRRVLEDAVQQILVGYARGTRYGIHADTDGLLAAGEPGQQLTWMDARVDGREITPRSGKPVEVQALWLNALRIGAGRERAWRPLQERGLSAFRERFWNAARDCLFDVVDMDHVAGAVDDRVRPNQVLAVGGLPFPLLEPGDAHARRVVAVVEAALWTPLGLRSLAPGEPGYVARYEGGVAQRDGAYHQGTVWPWLAGPFVEAWVRVRGGSPRARAEAVERFVTPLVRHLEEAGRGHMSEIADAEAPHLPRGCPFQAWSLGELLRLLYGVLAPGRRSAVKAAAREPAEAALAIGP